jgi:hypothetical protein
VLGVGAAVAVPVGRAEWVGVTGGPVKPPWRMWGAFATAAGDPGGAATSEEAGVAGCDDATRVG